MGDGAVSGMAESHPALAKWSRLPVRAKLALGASAILIISALAVLVTAGSVGEFEPLATGLQLDEAHEVVQALDDKKIPYQLQDGGTTVLVPQAQLNRARLHLAGAGVPQSAGGAGFELFDRNNLMFTDFTERIAYQRALQGELARTIKCHKGINAARVHLSIPEPGLFEKQAGKASASVTIDFQGNPSREQVRAIVQTVAHSVPGLEPERITVSTSTGRLVWPQPETEPAVEGHLTGQRKLETNLEERLSDLLRPLVGDHVVLRATVTLDPATSEVTSEQFGPTRGGTPLRSRRFVTEQYGSKGQSAQDRGYDRHEETVDYQISREVRHTELPAGRIQRLQVAVLVDAKIATPRTLDAIERAVRVAAGLDPSRGDELDVEAVPFLRVASQARGSGAQAAAREAAPAGPKVVPWPVSPVGLGLSLLAGIAIFLLARCARAKSKVEPAEQPTRSPEAERDFARVLDDWSHEHVEI